MTCRGPASALPMLAAAALLAGCGMLPHAPTPEVQWGAWPEARDRETRFTDIYDGFEHRANLWAVRLTPTVREARTRRLAAWLSWTAGELEARLAEDRIEAAKWDDFVIFLYTSKPKWNDLDAPQSIWRIEFTLGGDEVLPARVEALERTATLDALFPMGGAFDTAYRLRFQRTDAGPTPLPGVLRLASALGEMLVAYTPGARATPAPRPTD